jgi:exopolysaccharide biosynthesis polyprenyl glycosylphosphotransferase
MGGLEESGVLESQDLVALERVRARRRGTGARDGQLQAPEAKWIDADQAAGLASIRRDSLFRRGLLTADVVALMGAFALTVALSGDSTQLMLVGLCGLPVLLGCAKVLGLYDRDEVLLRKTTLDEAPKLFQLATMCALAAWLVTGLIVTEQLTRQEALLLLATLAGALMIARSAARGIALAITPCERCLFVGDEASALTVRSKLSGHSGVKAELVGHVNLEEVAPWSSDVFSRTRLAEIRDMARRLDVHRVIVAPRSVDPGEEVLQLVRTLKTVGVKVSVLPRLLEVVGSSVEFDDLHGVTLLGVRRFELTRSSRAVKRALDLAGASLGLVALGPAMLAIALAIKLDSHGPVFFRQLRVGRHGKRFYMVKFRTMVQDAEALKDSLREENEAQEGLFKIAADPRITRVGSLLRKCAIDEVPQLVNVFKGEMSLVGPRPLVIEEDDRIEGWQRQRSMLMPGMTGPWQILGPARVPLSEMVAIDYLYIANWSLWTDLKILLRTMPHVLARRGL